MTIAPPERAALDLTAVPSAGPVDLTPEQVRVLLMPLAANRVQHLKGNAHLEAWDVRRWLTRVFGFGGWALDTTELALVREMELKTGAPDKPSRWTVIYRAQVRLTIRTADGRAIASYEDAAMGDSRNQPSLGDAHDQAMKTALSQGLKRCAVNLGDQFGLSLYNNGSTKQAVIKSAAHPAPSADGAPPVPEQDEPVQPEPTAEPVPEQQPAPDSSQWETPRPPVVDTAPRRDYLAEARSASSPQEFARVRASAVGAGCSDEYADALDRIAAEKRAASQRPAPEPETLPGAPDDRKSIGVAVADMLAAAQQVGMSGPAARGAFNNRYGHTPDAATVAELHEFAALLARTTGGAQ